ncbi:13111_t:CDS:2 [Funneliformis caledonium]|uniref:13111_t:CDS:1 n=1 Tax=Funneliformis caledonium TaxID=1117310 RepID=A0A9N9C041_9GLOM|nr:13111_t:CDS:2 [Funneliformis caledonium]
MLDAHIRLKYSTQFAKNTLTIDNSVIDDKEYFKMFIKKVQELFENRSFKNIIEKISNNSTDIFEPVGNLNANQPFLIISDFTQAAMQQDVNIDKILQEHLLRAEFEFLEQRDILRKVDGGPKISE